MKTAQRWRTELSNGTKQAFPNIRRSDIIAGLMTRTLLPWTIDQKNASLCGPASFMYCVASRNADEYAQYVVDLYHTGEAWIGSLWVRPSEDCKNYQPHASKGIHPVDWVALASLRDSENEGLDYDDPDKEISGITPPGELAEWFWRALFKSTGEHTSLGSPEGSKSLNDANKRQLQQHRVCLLIDGDLLDRQRTSWSIPNHWVVLTSPANFKKNYITAKLYTYGRIQTVNVPVDTFCSKYFGYVAAR